MVYTHAHSSPLAHPCNNRRLYGREGDCIFWSFGFILSPPRPKFKILMQLTDQGRFSITSLYSSFVDGRDVDSLSMITIFEVLQERCKELKTSNNTPQRPHNGDPSEHQLYDGVTSPRLRILPNTRDNCRFWKPPLPCLCPAHLSNDRTLPTR